MLDPSRNELPDFFRQVIFPAKVTAVTLGGDGTTWLYDWTEQRIAGNGSLVDADAPRRGSATGKNAAREINNLQLSDFPTRVWMRLRGGARDGDTIYEFMAGGVATRLKVQLTGVCYYDGSGDREADEFTPDYGTERVCDADEDCLSPVREPIYGGVLLEAETVQCGLALSLAGAPRYFSPQCNPIYHLQKEYLPCYPEASPAIRQGSVGGDGGGGSVAWTNPSYGAAPDSRYATVNLGSGQTSNRLYISGFCYLLMGHLTLTTVEFRVRVRASISGVTDSEVKLLVNGSPVGDDKANDAAVALTDTVYTYSYSPSGWNYSTLKNLDVNRANFGVSLQYSSSASGATVYVADVECRLTYTPNGVTGGRGANRHSIVEIWSGGDGIWLMDKSPWMDFVRRSSTSDSDGVIAYHRYHDQNVPANRDGDEMRGVVMD